MDWQAFEDGMRRWFSYVSAIALDDVVWSGRPVGMLGYPHAYLDALPTGSQGGGTDEQRLESQGSGQPARVRLTGNRRLTLQCRVVSRSALPDERALVYLEHVRDAMALPSTQQVFERLGVGFIECAALVPLRRVSSKREQNEASMDILLNAALDKLTSETVGTIEHVRVGGTVNETIPIPPRVIP
jgi:hypothetical protein